MIRPFLAALVIGLILLFVEYAWRHKIIQREAGRKFIHIAAGSWIAFWPLFLEFDQISLLASLMLVVVMLSRGLNVFRSIHNVDRITWGELFFPLSILLCSQLTDSPWIFTAAILHLSIADGLAAVAGGRIKGGKYHVLKHAKSTAGTVTFFTTSIVLVVWLVGFSPARFDDLALPLGLLFIPMATTLAENLSPYGLDDLTVPLTALVLFSLLPA